MTTLASTWRLPIRGSAEARVRVWLALGLVAHLIVAVICLSSPAGHTGDFQRYWQLATSAGRPYADFAVEYPPAAYVGFNLLAHLTGSLTVFIAAMIWLNVVADTAIVALLAAEWGLTAAAVYSWIGLPILSLLYFRFDLWPLACAVAAVVLWARGRLHGCATALAAGVGLKLWPLPLAALLTRGAAGRFVSGPLVWFLSCGALGLALWTAFGGFVGVADVVTFRHATGWDIESTVGSLWRASDPASIRHEAGTLRAGRSIPLLSAALFAAGMPVAIWALYVGARVGRVGTAWVAGIGAMMAVSALLSPQFVGWLLPGAAIAWVQGDRRTGKGVAAIVAVTIAYRLLHTHQMPALVIGRNVLLIAVVVQALASLAAEARQQRTVFRFQPEGGPHR